MSEARNLRCVLPDGCLPVTFHEQHPCGGYYMIEALIYGPRGRIGRWLDARPHPITLGWKGPLRAR